VSFTWRKEPRPLGVERDEEDETQKGQLDFGYIAQEVEEVFPDLVETDESTGLKRLNYRGITPFLTEAFKDHDNRLERQENELRQVVARVVSLEKLLTKLLQNYSSQSSEFAALR